MPIGYHGRSSSIDVSGQTFHRPKGQTKAPDADTPSFGPCKRLDYELELGIYLGKGNALGDAIAIENAENHVFGFCVFIDWPFLFFCYEGLTELVYFNSYVGSS